MLQIFAGAMHYFLLATWLWMAVEAFYMYHALVKVFQTYYSRFLLKSILIAWGTCKTTGVPADHLYGGSDLQLDIGRSEFWVILERGERDPEMFFKKSEFL